MITRTTTEKMPLGWEKLTVNCVTVNGVTQHPMYDCLEDWLCVCTRTKRRNTKNCSRCNEEYDRNSKIFFAFTDDGPYHICRDCAAELRRAISDAGKEEDGD